MAKDTLSLFFNRRNYLLKVGSDDTSGGLRVYWQDGFTGENIPVPDALFNRYGNRITRFLRSHGLGPDDDSQEMPDHIISTDVPDGVDLAQALEACDEMLAQQETGDDDF